MKNSTSTKTSLGFAEVLTVVFVVLKLCNVIKWSWLWVLSPTWIPIALYLLILGIALCLKLWKNRGTIPCKRCKYRGCTTSNTWFGVRYHCLKDNLYHPTDYRCKDGEKEQTV